MKLDLSWVRNSVIAITLILTNFFNAYANEIEDDLVLFAHQSGIQSWPRLDGCAYSEDFTNKTVGIIIDVRSAISASARWDGRCHVPISHELNNWPSNLSFGRYIVAVSSEPDNKWDEKRNRTLNVIAVLGDKPNQDKLISAAIKMICSRGQSYDRDCEIKK